MLCEQAQIGEDDVPAEYLHGQVEYLQPCKNQDKIMETIPTQMQGG